MQSILTPEAAKVLDDAAAADIDVNTIARNAVEAEGADLTPSMLERFNLFVRRGVQPTVADITQKTDDFKFRNEAVKSSGVVNEVVTNQNRQLAELAREGKESIGATAGDLPQVNDSIFDSVNDLAETMDNAITEAYSEAMRIAPDEKNIQLTGMMDIFQSLKGADLNTGGLISALQQQLKNIGLVDNSGNPVRIDRLTPEAIAKRGLPEMSVRQAEQFRQFLNSKFDGANPQAKMVIREMKAALDADVGVVVGEDVFGKARQSVIDYHEAIGRDPSTKFEKRTRSIVEDILDGTVPRDQIVKKLQTQLTPDEFSAVKDFLLNKSGDSGISAWNNFKAQILQEAMDKAKGQKLADEVSVFKGKQFDSVFEALRKKSSKTHNNRLQEIFNADELELIDDISAIAELAKTDSRVGTGLGPSSQAIERASKRAADLLDMFLSRSTLGMSERVGVNAKALLDRLDEKKQIKLEEEFVAPERLIEEGVKKARGIVTGKQKHIK